MVACYRTTGPTGALEFSKYDQALDFVPQLIYGDDAHAGCTGGASRLIQAKYLHEVFFKWKHSVYIGAYMYFPCAKLSFVYCIRPSQVSSKRQTFLRSSWALQSSALLVVSLTLEPGLRKMTTWLRNHSLVFVSWYLVITSTSNFVQYTCVWDKGSGLKVSKYTQEQFYIRGFKHLPTRILAKLLE